MGIFLITYDINRLGHNETTLLTSIISDSFTQLSYSSYLIETNENEIEIQENITKYLNNNAAFQIIMILIYLLNSLDELLFDLVHSFPAYISLFLNEYQH